jgi:hypothetical protein
MAKDKFAKGKKQVRKEQKGSFVTCPFAFCLFPYFTACQLAP